MKKQEQDELMRTLAARFAKNMHRHRGIAWSDVQARLEGSATALRTLREMDSTGGEPDVIGHDKPSDAHTFCDCSLESPAGRRSVCYDREALESRKEHRPENSAVEMAAGMGIGLLTEAEYRALQNLGDFDTNLGGFVDGKLVGIATTSFTRIIRVASARRGGPFDVDHPSSCHRPPVRCVGLRTSCRCPRARLHQPRDGRGRGALQDRQAGSRSVRSERQGSA